MGGIEMVYQDGLLKISSQRKNSGSPKLAKYKLNTNTQTNKKKYFFFHIV